MSLINDTNVPIKKLSIHNLIKYKKRKEETLQNILNVAYTSVINPNETFFVIIREIYDVQTPHKLLCTLPIYRKIKFHITLSAGHGQNKDYDFTPTFTYNHDIPDLKLGRTKYFKKINKKISKIRTSR